MLTLAACGGTTGSVTLTSASPATVVRSSAPAVGAPTGTLPPDEHPPAGAAAEFKTDFSIHSVPYNEILSGGPPRDGIPAINKPVFVSVTEADAQAWLQPVEPVIYVDIAGDARAFPLQILVWHEIVNTAVGNMPVIVTFCPLCNTAIVFERTVSGTLLDFGTTGRLRYSNLIMYDRQTESWWQQASGTAIAGKYTGTQLVFRPASIISWAEFKTANPSGMVLSRETGFTRAYGRNPYPGYDDVSKPPFLYQGPAITGTLPAVARVLGVALHGDAVAYPFDVLKRVLVANDSVGGQDIAVFWQPGTASPFSGSTVADGDDVGSASSYSRELGGKRLHFRLDGERIVDQETGSEWNLLGRAVRGPLAGQSLTAIVAVNHFWFSWAAFKPGTRVYRP
jgi:hypothetical protein